MGIERWELQVTYKSRQGGHRFPPQPTVAVWLLHGLPSIEQFFSKTGDQQGMGDGQYSLGVESQ